MTVLKGYAFIQYEKEEEARAAVAGENGSWIKGQKIGKLPCVRIYGIFLSPDGMGNTGCSYLIAILISNIFACTFMTRSQW